MDMQSQVRAALKEKNPALFQQLTKAGTLTAFVQDQAEEINDQIVTLGHQIAVKNGLNRVPERPLLEKAGIMNSADKAATEIVLAEMLNFPTDEN